MEEQIRARIESLNEVGRNPFQNDFSFGFQTWKSGTLTLIKRLFPKESEIYDQIESIVVRRVDIRGTGPSAYNVESCKSQAREILTILLETVPKLNKGNQVNDSIWEILHPRVNSLARPRFENGQFADAVSACLREINTIMKNYVREVNGQELDGAPLMTSALSVGHPIISFADTSTETGRNIQLGYMKIFEGAMIGIRNPKAHENLYPDSSKAIHLLFISSFMFTKLQEAGIITAD